MVKVKGQKTSKKPQIQDVVETPPVNTSTGADLLESPELIFDKTEEFFKKNQKWVFIILGVVVAAVGAFVIYSFVRNSQQNEAVQQLYPAEYYFQADSLKKAYKGDGNNLGTQDIASDYPMSKAADVAAYMSGVALMNEGKFQEAVDYLKDFNANDMLVQGRAYCLMGDAYMEMKNYEQAIEYYSKAVRHYPNNYFTPGYLMKLALAQEMKKDYQAAIKTYDELIEEYPLTQDYHVNNAKKYKARLEALTGK